MPLPILGLGVVRLPDLNSLAHAFAWVLAPSEDLAENYGLEQIRRRHPRRDLHDGATWCDLRPSGGCAVVCTTGKPRSVPGQGGDDWGERVG